MTSPEKLEAFYRQAFQPMPQSVSITDNAAVNLRMAHAAEYAAAQLGIIARNAEKIESHLWMTLRGNISDHDIDMLRASRGEDIP
jgi:hypothetical protein